MRSVDIENGAYTVYEDGTVTSHRRAVLGVQQWTVDPAYSRKLACGKYGHYHHYKLSRGGKKKLEQAHRLIWSAFNGPIPPGMVIRHLDDNPSNNALSNLAVGTHRDNSADAERNNVLCSGERHGMHKLTADAVREMRTLAFNGASQKELSQRFGVHQAQVSGILCGQKWKTAGGPILPLRDRHGEGSALAVLTAEQVAEIRNTPRTEATDRALGERYGVSRSTVTGIRSGKSWIGPRKRTPRPVVEYVRPQARMRVNLLDSPPMPCSTRLNLLGGSFPLEEWRDVPGWEGYAASSIGRVRSTKRKVRRVLRPCLCGKYLSVMLSKSAHNHHSNRVHRVVCETFHGPAPEGMVARHLNGNRTDNRAANLAWGTYKENMADMFRHGRGQENESHWNARLTDADVAAMRSDRQAGMVYSELSSKYGVSAGHARDIVLGYKRKPSGVESGVSR